MMLTYPRAKTLLADVLPDTAACAEAFTDDEQCLVYPEEATLVAQAMPKRRAEFAAARHCARRALAQLGLPPTPIMPGPGRAPQWPKGIVGSITHCEGYRAAATARAADMLTIGIDAEPHGKLPAGVEDAISLPEEQERLEALTTDHPEVYWDRLLFCAKEAVYKAWFPLTQRRIWFRDVDISIDASGAFTARLLVQRPTVAEGKGLDELCGNWRVRRGLVVAAVSRPS